MAELKGEYSVEIRTPLIGGKFDFGTGYALGPHWILTAHHVLHGEDRLDEEPLSIVFRDEKGDPRSEISVPRDHIVWGDERFDIALIQCDFPDVNPPLAVEVIARERPSEGRPWCSHGYLSGYDDVDERKRTQTPSGVFKPGFSKAERISVTSTDDQLVNEAAWAGFSGTPIFSDGRLTGVVIAAEPGTQGRGLTISLLSSALEKGGADGRGLAQWLELSDYSARRVIEEKLKLEIVARLDGEPDAVDAINGVYRRFLDPDSGGGDASTLVESLLASQDEMVVHCLKKSLDQLVVRKDSASVGVVAYLGRTWLLFVSAERGTLRRASPSPGTSDGKPIAIKVVAPEVVDAEAMVAFMDGREPLLEIRGNELRAPLNYTVHQPGGLDADGSLECEDLHGALNLRALPGGEALGR